MPNTNSKRGRGWHGDSAGHARAGRKGGLARARNNRKSQSGGKSQSNGR